VLLNPPSELVTDADVCTAAVSVLGRLRRTRPARSEAPT